VTAELLAGLVAEAVPVAGVVVVAAVAGVALDL